MGLSAEDRDPSADPGVDFYRFANGGWLDSHPIPPGYGAWGSFEEINDRNEVILRELLERAAEDPVDELDRKLGDFFASGMDLEAIEAGGLEPIRPFLERIDGVETHDDVFALLPELHRAGLFALFAVAVTPDHDDSTRNLLWLAQGGLGLPDRDHYFAEGEAAEALRTAFAEHVDAQLANVGRPALGKEVLAFETRLAELHMRAQDTRDPDLTLNRRDLVQLAELAPDLPPYLRALGAGSVETVNAMNPTLLAGLRELVTLTEVETLRAYLAFHVVRATADALPAALDDEAFNFYGRRIRGEQSKRERGKRVIAAITADVGEALSQRYVAVAFPADAKDRALRMVEAIVAEMRASLETRPWMGDETRARALAKLDAMRAKIGYPDRWRDWSGLEVDRGSYAGNRLSATRFELARKLAQLDEPVDPDEWEMPPHVVNAYYHPTLNEIVFPAGILQPPLFDPAADDAINFGGIGTVIAHEITHGFDDQGRRFDADGAFRDWWTEEDEARFKAITDRLAEQFDAYVAIDDLHVNGRLTLGENIADLGGLALAQRALERRSAQREPIDGLTPDQRFFLANATLWRANVSPELQRTLVHIDPHSPRRLRVTGPISNLEVFRAAFGLADDAPIMRPRAEQIEIW